MSELPVQHDFGDPVIPIGTLARKVGLSVSAIRKYENEGLILAHRTESGHRFFSHEDIYRVRHIQHLIQDLGLNVAGIRRLLALIPCWDLLPCTDEMRQGCAAYRQDARPCWMMKDLECRASNNDCRSCVVYRFGSMCTHDIKRLLHDPNESPDDSAAVRQLLRQKRQAEEEER